jgi:ribosomal-protein-alanine N-acetyltransferase
VNFSTLPDAGHALVRLRPLAPADIPAWFAYLSLPLVHQHTSWNVKSAADLAHYATAGESRSPSAPLRVTIEDRATGALVGTIGFHSVSPENRSAELAYDLSPAFWGKGIATHLCRVMLEWGHSHVGLVRVQATVMQSNAASIKVLERCGFGREGLLRSYRMVRGTPGDFWMYSHVQLEGRTP